MQFGGCRSCQQLRSLAATCCCSAQEPMHRTGRWITYEAILMGVEQVGHKNDDIEWGCLVTFKPTGSMSLLPLGLVNSAERTEQRRSWWFGLVLCWAGRICCSTSGCMMQ